MTQLTEATLADHGDHAGAVRISGRDLVALGVAVAAVAGLIWALTLDIESELKGALAALLMLCLLLLKVPIGVAMGTAGAIGIWTLSSSTAMINTISDVPFNATASFTLSVLPMFVFMGIMLYRSGITERLYDVAREWVGWMPGGLAVTTTMAGAGLAAASGSTIGISYALGRIGIPEMLRAGYDKRLAVGSVMVAGTIGQLIPPSILLVVYAGFAEVPVGPQLLAGFLPGILLALCYAALIMIYVLARPSLAPRSARQSATWGQKWRGAASIWPLPAIVAIVIGGLYVGVFTATEAGAFGALGAVVLAASRLPFREFLRATVIALRDTVASVGGILFLLMGAAILNRMLALSGAARWLAQQVEAADLNRVGLIVLMVVLYLILGMFMEPISMMLLTVPILLPTVVATGIDPIWFGVFIVLLGEIGILTPPVGVLVFVMHRLVQDPEVRGGTTFSLGDVFTGALWLVPGALATVALITAFPDIVSFLPELGAPKG